MAGFGDGFGRTMLATGWRVEPRQVAQAGQGGQARSVGGLSQHGGVDHHASTSFNDPVNAVVRLYGIRPSGVTLSRRVGHDDLAGGIGLIRRS